jgi:hypothetical protein
MANRQTKGLDERRKFHSTIGLIYNSLPTTTKLQTVPGETHQDRSCCHLSLSLGSAGPGQIQTIIISRRPQKPFKKQKKMMVNIMATAKKPGLPQSV